MGVFDMVRVVREDRGYMESGELKFCHGRSVGGSGGADGEAAVFFGQRRWSGGAHLALGRF